MEVKVEKMPQRRVGKDFRQDAQARELAGSSVPEAFNHLHLNYGSTRLGLLRCILVRASSRPSGFGRHYKLVHVVARCGGSRLPWLQPCPDSASKPGLPQKAAARRRVTSVCLFGSHLRSCSSLLYGIDCAIACRHQNCCVPHCHDGAANVPRPRACHTCISYSRIPTCYCNRPRRGAAACGEAIHASCVLQSNHSHNHHRRTCQRFPKGMLVAWGYPICPLIFS